MLAKLRATWRAYRFAAHHEPGPEWWNHLSVVMSLLVIVVCAVGFVWLAIDLLS